jgi:hypothetical protein
LTCCVSATVEAAGPVHIARGEPQLFVDDEIIASHADLRRTLHQPIKDDGGNVPVIALEQEFDVPATLEANGSIVYDARLNKWVMYAIGFAPSAKQDRIRIYRFTSPDAINWTKGDHGQAEHIRFDLKDAASGTSATNTDVFSCYYDANDSAYPYKGWLWFANWGDLEGLYYVQSRDGHAWERGPCVARIKTWQFDHDGRRLVGPGDVSLFTHDPATNRFLALIKFNAPEPLAQEFNNHLRSRTYQFVTSLRAPIDPRSITHVELVPPASEANGDLPHDEYYGSTAWRYGPVWLGGLKIWHGGGDYPYSAAGCAFLKLAVSRDGLKWRKVPFHNDGGVPEVFLANGTEGGNNGRNDGGYLTEFSQGPLKLGDQLIFYYGASSWGKNHASPPRVTGGGIFRARLRMDGFVSVDGGTLTTPPLTFEGNDLFINAVGQVQVDILNNANEVITSTTVIGDNLRHQITLAGLSLRNLAGERGGITLRFTVPPGGQLYSFTIQ